MKNFREIAESWKNLSKASQEEEFPYFIDPKDVFGLKIQIIEHVFSPKYTHAYSFFTTHLPDMTGKRFLEIGCGHGVTSCYIAKKAQRVLAVDINKYAVENTKINAGLNTLNNLEARYSDVYSGIGADEKFDAIYWNPPWLNVPKDFENMMTPEDYGMFDPEYKSISRFILEGTKYLTETGALYLGLGIEVTDNDAIDMLTTKAGLLKEEIASGDYAVSIENKPARFTLKLYKLTPLI